MHIPDGYLGPVTYGTMFVVMAPILAVAVKKVNQSVKALQIPYLAMGTVSSLLIMLFVLPLPGGTSGHMSGATLVAILLGPWSALIAVSISIIIQALIMGDGGITAIGANCFNIAFIGSFIGYHIYRTTLMGGAFFLAGKAIDSGEPASFPLNLQIFAAVVSSYLALNLGAFAAAMELGIQPLLHSASIQTTHYFPYPLKYALPATMVPHLTMVGALEAAGTALVLICLHKSGMFVRRISKHVVICLLAVTIMMASVASAHDYWIERKADHYRLIYGHGEQHVPYDPEQMKTISVYSLEGKPVPFRRETSDKGWIIRPQGPAALILVACDSGYWSKTIYGWKNLPRRKASRVVEAIRSYHYSKSIVSWSDVARKPITGMSLDIVPLKNPFDLQAGEALPLSVTYSGRPLAGAVIEGDHEKVAVTDGEGIAKVPLKKGRRLLTVEHKEPIKGDPDADVLLVTTTLTFEVTK